MSKKDIEVIEFPITGFVEVSGKTDYFAIKDSDIDMAPINPEISESLLNQSDNQGGQYFMNPCTPIPAGWHFGILPQNPYPQYPLSMSNTVSKVIESDSMVQATNSELNQFLEQTNQIRSIIADRECVQRIDMQAENIKNHVTDAFANASVKASLMSSLLNPTYGSYNPRIKNTLFSIVRIFSTEKKKYYSFHPGINIVFGQSTITPEDPEFYELASDHGVTLDLLENFDCFGVQYVQGGESELDYCFLRAPVYTVPKGTIATANRVIGDDISVFMNTGMVYFRVEADADRCLRECQGNILKYVNLVLAKERSKTENLDGIFTIKSTVFAGIVGIVSWFFKDFIIDFLKKKKEGG